MENITAIVPFWNGHGVVGRLLDSLPDWMPVVIVDDDSDTPLNINRPNVRLIRQERGYFSGAVNTGINACKTDVLVLNQDAKLQGDRWLQILARNRATHALIGDGVMKHPAWPKGYVQGTFMYIRRDAWEDVGGLNTEMYPLWGATCEWQLRASRKGYKVMPLDGVPGLIHSQGRRQRGQRYGSSISLAMHREPEKKRLFARTPPMVSVIMPCYNYGRYLPDAVNSLIGGETCLGQMSGQTMQSFEIIIVDDCSTDDSWDIALGLADRWKGIRTMRMPENVGLPTVLNHAIERSYGQYIHILSADDMREGWCLETLLQACLDNPHMVSYGDIRILKNGERKRGLRLPEYDFDKILSKNPMPAGIMYPKKAWRDVNGYPEQMRYGREDWAFNVALGAAGWCGIHVGDSGNLYRREGQNRSLQTSNVHKGEVAPTGTRDWRPFFLEQLKELYPSLYKGEKPMGCCGRGSNKTSPTSRSTQRTFQELPGQAGMAVLEYTGINDGEMTFWGDETRTAYRFGGSRRKGYVDVRDVPGFLDVTEGRKLVFRRVQIKKKRPQPIEKKVEPVVVEPEPGEVKIDDARTIDDIPGVGKTLAERLLESGFSTVADIARADLEDLVIIKGISLGRAESLIEYATQ